MSNNLTEKPILIKAPQASKLIGVSIATFYRMKKRDDSFPISSHVGGATFFKTEDIITYAENIFNRGILVEEKEINNGTNNTE